MSTYLRLDRNLNGVWVLHVLDGNKYIRRSYTLGSVMQWIGAFFQIAGALLLAANLTWSMWAFPLMLIGSVIWIWWAYKSSDPALGTTQLVFAFINILGIWRWFPIS